MEWFETHWLSTLVFLPLIWGTVGLAFPTHHTSGQKYYRNWVLLGTLLTFVFSVVIYQRYLPNGEEFQFVEKVTWIASLGIDYHLGMDGISLLLIVLTTFLCPLVVLSSFSAIEERQKEYYFLLLFLQSAMLGAFVALDIFLFYVFWEAMLIPMYFLIGIWGGKERIYATMKFFIFTMAGSLLMLVAIFALAHTHYNQFGEYSTNLLNLYSLQLTGDGWLSPQALMFMAFALAFAIKVPLFPLHTWLPDAHVQAPTAGSVILAGVLLKMGGYGFIRFAFPLFPEALPLFQLPFMILGGVAVVYGAWVAMIQPDVKKLVAYSSVSHMGFVVIGLFAMNKVAVTGSIYQMLNHGISTGALFLLVGMIYERRHTREISAFGGITKCMPLFATAFLIVTFSSIALPGTNGFVGEFLILLGSWKSSSLITAIAGTGVIFGAVYMLWMFQRVMFGPVTDPENEKLEDLNPREMTVLIPLIVAIFVMGIYPQMFLDKIEGSVNRVMSRTVVSDPQSQGGTTDYTQTGKKDLWNQRLASTN